MSEGLDPILQQKEQQQLKTQLLWRLGIAAGVIAALLGGIAWLEKSQDSGEPNVQIPQIAPELNAGEPSSFASAASAASTAEPSPTPSLSPEPSPLPEPTATPSNNSSAIQKIENAPKFTATPTPSIKPQARIENITTAIPLKNPSQSTKPAPITPATQASLQQNKTPLDYPAAVNSSRGYSVQAGVFLHSNNAEKLLGQLQQAGIPAYLETRVQIGPFKNKAEADAAVKKLKALGITPIVKTE
ncbi:SPOR domain-containing protein [Chitinibacter sp. SCUT-21]|uniref:SPOR domain-containing protein n=1 Tax=Chitinibacter sp. SCUT-21 TaxID=2970891 RepID=UPI0035A620E9